MKVQDHLCIKSISGKKISLGQKKYYRIFWISGGIEKIKINTTEVPSYANHILFVIPGIKIEITPKSQANGWVIEFDKFYFDLLEYEPLLIKEAQFYYTLNKIPQIVLSPKIGGRVQTMFEMIDEMSASEIPNKENGMFSLMKTILIYCDSKCNVNLNKELASQNLATVIAYKELVAQNYTRWHKVSDYSAALHISSKQLNTLVKCTLGKTAKSLIKEQLIIHARRDLKFTDKNIKEIAFNLGFREPFHFSNFFKTTIGCSPSEYRIN